MNETEERRSDRISKKERIKMLEILAGSDQLLAGQIPKHRVQTSDEENLYIPSKWKRDL